MLSNLLVKIAAEEEAEKEPSEYYPRCSIAGDERCKRAETYWALNYPPAPMPGRFVILLQDSTFHEELTADWIRKSAYKLHSQQMGLDCAVLPFGGGTERYCKLCDKQIDGDRVHGHCDGILTDMLESDLLWEHKAIGHFQFQHYWGSEEYPLNYITQCCLYKKGIQKINPDIKKICLNIKNKNTSQMIDYVIEYDIEKDEALVTEVEHSNGKFKYPNFIYSDVIKIATDRFIEIEEYRSQKILPPRQFEMNDWQCEYCKFYETCWKDYEKEYKELADNAVLEGEIEELAKYYLEVNMHLLEMEKEKETLKGKIKKILTDKNARKGRVGIYTIHNQLQKYKSLNKELISEDVLKKATEEKFKEVLTVRLPPKEKA